MNYIISLEYFDYSKLAIIAGSNCFIMPCNMNNVTSGQSDLT